MVSESEFRQRGMTLLYRTINLIIQSILYGIYASVIPISTYIMIKKGLHSLGQRFLFGVVVGMFLLSTGYLSVSMADFIILIKTWYLDVHLSESAGSKTPLDSLLVLFNALSVINYVLTDGVVVWRAWVICRDESKKLLMAAIVMLILSMLGVIATIGVRIYINADPLRDQVRLAIIINVFQEITLISSLVTNILGTGTISLKAWRYRRWIVKDLQRIVSKRTKAERVMAILIESGVFYIFSGSMLVASSFIRLPGTHNILGNMYSQAAVQLAGIYPPIVIILINREATMDKTVFGIDPAGPVIITDLQQASYHSRANQVAARQTKSTPLASIQISAAPGPCPTRDSLDVDAWPSQHSLASSTNARRSS